MLKLSIELLVSQQECARKDYKNLLLRLSDEGAKVCDFNHNQIIEAFNLAQSITEAIKVLQGDT